MPLHHTEFPGHHPGAPTLLHLPDGILDASAGGFGCLAHLAFSLADESSEGSARLSDMLDSALGEYAASGIPLPWAAARIMDVVYGEAGGRRRGLDERMAGPEREHHTGKA